MLLTMTKRISIPELEAGVPELPATVERLDGEYVLTARARIPRPLAEVFPFFSNARNLAKLTPENMHFTILTEGEIDMKPGTILDYKFKVKGLPVRWRTEITVWEPPHRFADLQAKGPFRQWIHEHRFIDEGESTLMQDRVRYKVWGGCLVHWLVKRDNAKVFAFRNKVMQELFPPKDSHS